MAKKPRVVVATREVICRYTSEEHKVLIVVYDGVYDDGSVEVRCNKKGTCGSQCQYGRGRAW